MQIRQLSVFAVLLAALALTSPPGAAQEPAPAGQPAATDARLAAHELQGELLNRRGFVGVMDFQCLREKAGESAVENRGRVYYGPDGAVRLDLWTEGADAPIVCAVSERRVWMVRPGSLVVHESEYPLPFEPNGGWPSVMKKLAVQTQEYADQLLYGAAVLGQPFAPTEAVVLDSGLRFRIPATGTATGAAERPVDVCARYNSESGRWLPVLLKDGYSAIELAEYAPVGDELFLARQQRLTASGGRATQTWSVTEARPIDPQQATAFFETPAFAMESEFPSVQIKITYNREGEESFLTLPAQP